MKETLGDVLDSVVDCVAIHPEPSLRELALAANLDPTKDFIGASLVGLDLRDQDLRGFDFSGADLRGVDFRRANVEGVCFDVAQLDGAIGLVRSPISRRFARPKRRVALVIGNAAYQRDMPLAKPEKNAADVAQALKRLGFEVVAYHNLGLKEMRDVLRDFEDRARGADWALMYYSGHAVELNGKNWLIPVDASPTRSTDLSGEAVPMEGVAESLSGARKLRIMILDAAPLGAIASAYGEVVFCAARPHTLAWEGSNVSRNSFFTEALLKHMEVEGLELNRFFRKVTSSVLEAFDEIKQLDPTVQPQEPFVYGSIPDEDFYFKPPLAHKGLTLVVAEKLGGFYRK